MDDGLLVERKVSRAYEYQLAVTRARLQPVAVPGHADIAEPTRSETTVDLAIAGPIHSPAWNPMTGYGEELSLHQQLCEEAR
ncbi:hypothetical protein PAN31117_05064 [Pandoraea anapnoica]|uniref:Uncharacterized protein n=2 Tax=Burkholderiaceae TaxID=119060 RepID=A0A5E5AQF0_9BURK|nr:hypothetical protein PIN31009_05336 [Pandoraea iniqua]VVE75032.1 hypothetical protein PAN31117_05064 [Pandoraea anapnoica]